jgi:hypothetical protein
MRILAITSTIWRRKTEPARNRNLSAKALSRQSPSRCPRDPKKSRPGIGRLVCDLGLAKSSVTFAKGYCTTWFNTGDVLLSLKLSPEYCAVIGCVAKANVDLVSLATPPLNVADPIPTVPSKNFTLAASA